MAKKAKRNPQDLTLRNLRAIKKRVERLEAVVAEISIWRTFLENRLAAEPKATVRDAITRRHMAARRPKR